MVQQNLECKQAVLCFIMQNAAIFFYNKGNALCADAMMLVVADGKAFFIKLSLAVKAVADLNDKLIRILPADQVNAPFIRSRELAAGVKGIFKGV